MGGYALWGEWWNHNHRAVSSEFIAGQTRADKSGERVSCCAGTVKEGSGWVGWARGLLVLVIPTIVCVCFFVYGWQANIRVGVAVVAASSPISD